MAQDIVLTREGFEELSEKLRKLKSEGRPDIAEKLKVARSFGDLSENSEYDEAKSEQAKLEAEILDIENMLKRAVIIDGSNSNSGTVNIGSVVTVSGAAGERVFTITSYAQANPAEGKISDNSPVGKALMGHSVGEEVVVEAPSGAVTFKIVKIES